MYNNKSSKEIMDLENNTSSSTLNDFSKTSPSLFASLTEKQKEEAMHLVKSIDISNIENVLSFGSEIQKQLKNFTHNLFVHVQRRNTSAIRESLFQLQKWLEKMDTSNLSKRNKNFLSKFFLGKNKSIQEIISEYHRLSKVVDKLSIQLQHAQNNLVDDCKMLDQLYEKNKLYFEKLNIYISAAEIKKQWLKNNELPKLKGDTIQEDSIENPEIFEVENAIEWLDRRIYEMQISKEIALQTAPQIRMIQQTNELLLEKIQSSILTTIPLWQSQISMIVNLSKQQRLQQTAHRLEKQLSNGLQISNADLDEIIKTKNILMNFINEALTVESKNFKLQNKIEQTIEQFENKKNDESD